MHIPDGYISPSTAAVTYAVALPLWIYGFKKLKSQLNEETIPLLGALSAMSFVVMMFNIPIPGGTSGHAVGAALIALIFGPWIGFIAVSLVLLIQALVFGDGGISTYALNALAMAFTGSFVGYYLYRTLQNLRYTPFLAGWASAVASSFAVAFALGIQPLLFTQNGQPLYFPFGLGTTMTALVGSHLLFFGIVEGLFTQLVYSYIKKEKKEPVYDA